jgi:ubiquinone/menaquinone biosynthesis C-methylase UbiE
MAKKKSEKLQEAYEQIDRLSHAYRYSQVIFTAYESGLLEVLSRSKDRSPEEIAGAANLSEKGVTRILTALCALNIADKKQGRFKLAGPYRQLFNPDADNYLGGMFDHEIHLQKRWTNLLQSIKSGEPAKKTDQKRTIQDKNRFIKAMATLGRRSSPQVIYKLNLKDNQHILDLGGGPGLYMESFLAPFSHTKVTLFDQPETIRFAKKRLATHPSFERMFFQEGDMLKDDYGKNYDIIFISNVIHIFSLKQIRHILKNSHKSLKPAGRVFIKDFFLNEHQTGPVFSSLFSLHMMLSTEHGGCYRVSEIMDLLRETGFRRGRQIKFKKNSQILEGIKK